MRRRFALSLIFGLLVVTALAFIGDAPRVIAAGRHFAWAYVPAVLALTAFNYLLRGLKWQYYLRLIGARVSKADGAAIFACGLSMAMTPGKVGELLKAWLLRARTGTPMAVSAPVILAERLTDGVAMLILASAGLLLYRHGWQALGARCGDPGAIAGHCGATIGETWPVVLGPFLWLREPVH